MFTSKYEEHPTIRPVPCHNRMTGETGVCTFNWSCINVAHGIHIGPCVDRFFVGTCCKVPQDNELNKSDSNGARKYDFNSEKTFNSNGENKSGNGTGQGTRKADQMSTYTPFSHTMASQTQEEKLNKNKPLHLIDIEHFNVNLNPADYDDTQYRSTSIPYNHQSSNSQNTTDLKHVLHLVHENDTLASSPSQKLLPSVSTNAFLWNADSQTSIHRNNNATTDAFNKTEATSLLHFTESPNFVKTETPYNWTGETSDDVRRPVATHSTQGLRKPIILETSHDNRKPVAIHSTHDLRKPIFLETFHDNRKPVAVHSTHDLRKPIILETSHDNRKPVTTEDTHDLRRPVDFEKRHNLRWPVKQEEDHKQLTPVDLEEGHDLRWPVLDEEDHDLRTPDNFEDDYYARWTVSDKNNNNNHRLPELNDDLFDELTDIDILYKWIKSQNPDIVDDFNTEHPLENFPEDDILIFRNPDGEITSKATEATETEEFLNQKNTKDSMANFTMFVRPTSSRPSYYKPSSLPPEHEPIGTKNILNDSYEVCGRPTEVLTARIVGGIVSHYLRWPWMISLRRLEDGSYVHKCGATLLNQYWATTAAHCVDGKHPSDVLLRLGEYDFRRSDDLHPHVERKIYVMIIHPEFDPITYENDLALLRFQEPVEFQENIIPICLPHNLGDITGELAVVTGWGRLREGELPTFLHEVRLPIISNEDCEQMYYQSGYKEQIRDVFICAGISHGGLDACEGDSGGPMVIKGEHEEWILAGLISWGMGCAAPNQPGVYTRISRFTDWIERIIAY
ncbi:serine proteinase stubble [Caerostris darwini]|uniref:Serine proteinase stubble n=1 Tax=Caerostris darwini TaxID=1538125 RepID=A0AAV4WNI5_9ARAC|nr:serine proteinase stubble [Caerostris darwini]